MNVFLEGGGGGLFRSMGLRRAGEVGAQAEIQPIELILGSAARSTSSDFRQSDVKVFGYVNIQDCEWAASSAATFTP